MAAFLLSGTEVMGGKERLFKANRPA